MSGTRRPSRAAPLAPPLSRRPSARMAALCTHDRQLLESPRAKRACTGSPLRRPALRRPALRLDGGWP